MKRLFIAALAVTITTTSFASTVIASTQGTSVTALRDEADDKTPVKLEDLPAPVKKSLGSSDFEGWTPVTAYWVKKEKSSYYEIELTRGEEKKSVNLTAEGARVL